MERVVIVHKYNLIMLRSAHQCCVNHTLEHACRGWLLSALRWVEGILYLILIRISDCKINYLLCDEVRRIPRAMYVFVMSWKSMFGFDI